MRISVTALCGLLLFPALAFADLDDAGNWTDGGGNGPQNPDGAQCGTCPAPAGDAGVDFKNGELYVIAGGQINHFVNCAIVGATPIVGINVPFGLGYDT